MKQYVRLCLFVCWASLVCSPAIAQNPSKKGQKQYNSAKNLLGIAKYAEARVLFDAVYQNAKNYNLRPNALFYVAIVQQKEGQEESAQATLNKLLEEYPSFEAKEEAVYMLADLLFKKKEYEKALTQIDCLQNHPIADDAESMRGYYLRQTDLKTLQNLLQKRPEDRLIGQFVVDKIAATSTKEDEIEFMEKLVETLKLEKPTKMRFERKIFTKPIYKIAVLLPFDAERIKTKRDTSAAGKVSMALYQGMRVAQRELDTLNGVKVRFYTYDIGRNDKAKLAKLLNDKEFQDVDAFVGPLFDTLARSIADILPTQKSLLINPISLDPKMLINKQTYLYESTAETQAQQIVEFLQTKGENKNMVILYDDIARNKNLATLTKQKAEAQGFKILAFEEASVSNLEIIKTILQKYNKFEIGSIFVSSSSSTVAEELVKHIQVEGHTATIVAHESWLRLQSLEYELYEKLHVHIFYPEYLDSETQKILPFKKGYAILTRKEIANNNQYSYVGYEIVHHLAKMWSMAGTQTDYSKLLEKISPYQGKTGDWLQYNKGKQDNQFVPILRFENGDLKIANEPK